MYDIRNVAEIKIEGQEPINAIFEMDYEDKRIKAVEIKHGLKIEVRDYILENIKNEQYVKDNYNLNIKRLNRWWYSVYFDEKNKGKLIC